MIALDKSMVILALEVIRKLLILELRSAEMAILHKAKNEMILVLQMKMGEV